MDRQTLRTKTIGVLMGGASSEREISLASGRAVLESLLRMGFHAHAIDAKERLVEQLREKAVDVAFVALHGRWGEDGTVQGLLEMLGLPYTGSGVLGSAVAMDKCVAKFVMDSLHVPTPSSKVYHADHLAAFPIPFVVKPAREGSTIGISIVREESQAARAVKEALCYDRKLLLEEYINGPEITVGVVNGTVLPIVELRPASGFYDFTAKYTKGMTEYIVPAPVDEAVAVRARDIARIVWTYFELSGCARVDMLLDGKVPKVIDINTSPGMTETSLIPKAWQQLGRTFDELIEEILMGADLKA